MTVRAVLRPVSRWAADPRRPYPVQRRRYERVSAGLPQPRATRVEPATLAGVAVERVTAAGAAGERLIVHLHGGGFCIGSPATHRGFAARLSAATGATVVLPDYRLAPEHPCPAAADDALAVWSAVVAEHPDAVLSGDSAGGGLALQVAVRAAVPPSALVLISPFVDAAADHAADADLVARDVILTPDWLLRCALSYAAGRPLDDPAVSAINLDLQGLPPTLVVYGTDELLAPECERLVARLTDVEVLRGEGLWHIYPTQAGTVAAADEAIASIAAFVRRAAAAAV